MTEDNFNLESAYEADLAYRTEKARSVEEELQATKDYVNILNTELNNAKEQVESIKRTLFSSEREAEEIRQKNKRKIIWLFLALFEAVLLIILAVAFFSRDTDVSVPVVEDKQVAQNVPTEAVPADAAPATYKYVENLEERVNAIDKQKIAPFTASVINRYGFEYLCYSYGALKLMYRNEFNNDETTVVQRIQMDNGTKLAEFNRKYDLTAELEQLCPSVGEYLGNGKEQLLFSLYNANDTHCIPEKMEFFDVERLWDYETLYVHDEIQKLMLADYPEKPESAIEMPEVVSDRYLTILFNEVSYNYRINQEDYTNAVYNGESLVNIADESTFNMTEEGISFIAVLSMSEDRYLGEISAGITLDNGVISLADIKYGAYVPSNQEDPDFYGIIEPYEKYIEDRVTIGGLNGERFIVEKLQNITMCEYDWERLDNSDPNDWKYMDEQGEVISHKGIDVSKYQGSVNWNKVKEAGVEFAIIRLGYRGMNEGTLEMDPYYRRNIKDVNMVGIKAGIYFFSQAVTEEEAREEAEYVLKNIRDYNIEYPIIFDTERVTTYDARANNLSMKERTKICRAFCDEIKAAGYTPMIYANTRYMIMGLDLEQLTEYDKWFAYYGNTITFPYDFQILQYSDSGSMPGVDAAVDLNISFRDY